jgi:hypothetical protein
MKEKTKAGPVVVLASLGRLTILFRLFQSEREKMRTPSVISPALTYTFFSTRADTQACARARASIPTAPTDEVAATTTRSNTIRCRKRIERLSVLPD